MIGLCAAGIQTGDIAAYQLIEAPAREQLEIAYTRLARFSQLQRSFLDNNRLLLTYVGRPELLKDYGYHLSTNAMQLQTLLDEIAADAASLADSERMYTEVGPGLSRTEINRFIRWCENVGSNYDASISPILTRASASGIASQTIADTQSQLVTLLSDYTVVELETCALRLDDIIIDSQDSLTSARDYLSTAKQLQAQITYVSLGLSLLVAIALSVFNSWAITRPLAKVSQAAQQITQSEDFGLQIPIKTADEVGVVARSFNEVIRKVEQLLQEQRKNQQQLEYYNQVLTSQNQNLEEVIQARTQDLNQQNISLKETVQALQEAKTQLFQAEKMSSLGQLVAGIAHEINNPVNFIHGNLTHAEDYFTELLAALEIQAESCNLPAEARDRLEALDLDFVKADSLKLVQSMRMGTERIRQIVLSLRNFSRLDESEQKTVDIHEGIDSTLLILGHRLKANDCRGAIAINKQYNLNQTIDCFPGLLNQVFMNLLSNAIDALDEQALAQPGKAFEIAISTAQLEDGSAQIKIVDNGPGIPKQVREKIFEPFFTTKEVGKGTGMGLSISYKIITERHHGDIQCSSVPEEGTTFSIKLPIKPQTA